MKKAIVVVSFGTTVKEAMVCIENVEKAIAKVYPEHDFYRAFTSEMILKKLKDKGTKIMSPKEAVELLKMKEYSEVMIFPSHVIPGFEYDKLKNLCETEKASFDELYLGKPLILNMTDLLEVAETLDSKWRKQIPAENAIIYMGHGTKHTANFIYPALQTAFLQMGRKKSYVATVEGWPELKDAVTLMKNDKVSRVDVVPFLLTAGDHVRNDMAGDDENSWKNILIREGFEVTCHVTGMGEIPEILKLYEKHAEIIKTKC